MKKKKFSCFIPNSLQHASTDINTLFLHSFGFKMNFTFNSGVRGLHKRLENVLAFESSLTRNFNNLLELNKSLNDYFNMLYKDNKHLSTLMMLTKSNINTQRDGIILRSQLMICPQFINCSFINMHETIKFLGFKSITIVNVYNLYNIIPIKVKLPQIDLYTPIDKEVGKVYIIHIKFDDLFRFDKNIDLTNTYYNNLDTTIFILHDIQVDEVRNKLLTKNIHITGGGSNSTYLFNPLYYRFSMFISILGIKYTGVCQSFDYYMKNKKFNNYNKKTSKPHDTGGVSSFKRYYYTSICKPNYKKYPQNTIKKYHLSTLQNSDNYIIDLVKKDPILYSLLDSVIYKRLNKILISDKDSISKQLEIEEEINNYNKSALDDLLKTPKLFYNKLGLSLLISTIKLLDRDLTDYKKSTSVKNKAYKNILDVCVNSVVISIIISCSIPYIFQNSENKDIIVTPLSKIIGVKLFNEYLWLLYNKYNEYYKINQLKGPYTHQLKTYINNKSTMLEFKLEKNMSFKDFSSVIKSEKLFKEDFFILYGLDMLLFFSTKSKLFILENKYYGKNHCVTQIIPTSLLSKEISDYLAINEYSYPMVTSPKNWEIETSTDGNYVIKSYGGYFTESSDERLIHKPHKNIGETKFYNDNIIKAINYLQSVEYVINNEVFEKILVFYTNSLLNQYIILDYHPETSNLLNLKISKDKIAVVKRILSHNSQCYVNRIILTNSILYRNSELFFPIFMDFRGRLYTNTPGFSVQGNELIKSLLCYKKGFVLTESGLTSLKYYTANCYGNSKKSNDKKLEWVDNNISKIIDIDSGFWLEASDVLLALAVSIELKNYYKNPKEFISRLPVYVDATCNGLQHLSSMINDINLAKKVNIYKSTNSDVPVDIYSLLVSTIKDGIEESITKNPKLRNLKHIDINRSFIKRGIMTISYGVTVYGIKEQLTSDFFDITDTKIEKSRQYLLDSKYLDKSVGYDVYFSKKDIFELSKIIHGVLYKEHVNLKKFVDYLMDMNHFLNNINLSIGMVWKTPSGLLIEQKYVKMSKSSIKTLLFTKPKSLIISKPTNVIDIKKQDYGIVPNLVHSMDASNICILINKFISSKHNMDISTIHDCFGSQANNIELLSFQIKAAFLDIYRDQKFIVNFHTFVLKYISELGVNVDIENKTAYISDKCQAIIPDIPLFQPDNYLESSVLNSRYFVK